MTADLFSSYNLQNKNICLNLDFEQIYLGLDTAIPLGIIVNELVTNSLKHAFPNGNNWEISISLKEINFRNADSLGLQLVNILVEQIEGCLELRRNQGTEFCIGFNDI